MGLHSGWPIGRLGHVLVGGASMDLGRMPLVGVQQRMISPGVVDESLVYPRYIGML